MLFYCVALDSEPPCIVVTDKSSFLAEMESQHHHESMKDLQQCFMPLSQLRMDAVAPATGVSRSIGTDRQVAANFLSTYKFSMCSIHNNCRQHHILPHYFTLLLFSEGSVLLSDYKHKDSISRSKKFLNFTTNFPAKKIQN